MSSQAVGIARSRIPLARPSSGLRAATGALWGLAVAGLSAPPAFDAATGARLAGLSAVGALLALAGALPADALRHPGLAAAAATCGLVMVWRPEPTFFLLVPLLAAGLAWPFGTPPADEKPPNCTLKPENQYLLDVRAPEKYVACAGKGSNESCGVCILGKDSFGVIHKSPAGLCGLD